MHRRVQLAANIALIVLVVLAGIQAFWPEGIQAARRRVGLSAESGAAPPINRVRPPTDRGRPPIAPPAEPVSVAGAPLLGSPDAPVVLIEHSDFECPFCESFQRVTLPVLKQEYLDAGTVVLAYRHMPLPTLHPRAVKAAEAAACAARQGRFWEMHDALFENQRALDDEALEGHAARAGVDLETWRACVAEGLTSAEVAVEAAEAARLGLTGTPAFLVGVRQPDGSVRVLRVISGAKPLEEFREALDEALAVNAVDEAAR